MQIKTETTVGLFILCAISVFIYMGFQIGAFRFDRKNYTAYTVYFNDISGLSRKAEVKIAGVKVGWVEDISLIPNHEVQAEVTIMVLKEYSLYADSSAVIRRDGLLGVMYLELVPGDPLMRALKEHDTLGKPSKTPVNIDEILHKFQNIAHNVEDVSQAFKESFGSMQGKEQLQQTFNNLHTATERMASFSEIISRTIERNEHNLDSIMEIGQEVRRLSNKLTDEVLPSFQTSIEKISTVFDRDFNRVANRFEKTTESFEEAALEARDGLRAVSSVASKIDEGKGLLGKLINEDDTYQDLKTTVAGLKNYFAKVDNLQIIFDSHFESMQRPAVNYRNEDSKGYFDIRIHQNEDYFYLIQFVSSERGFPKRKTWHYNYFDRDGKEIIDETTLVGTDKIQIATQVDEAIIERDALRFGFQFGKIFSNIAVRFGLFESFAGVAFDFDIPFDTEKLRWVTSLEGYDFNGRNRIHEKQLDFSGRNLPDEKRLFEEDRRPHLKWINRIYFMRNLYFTFGADDFISKTNANAFFGAGIRFGDDDVKYFVSRIGTPNL